MLAHVPIRVSIFWIFGFFGVDFVYGVWGSVFSEISCPLGGNNLCFLLLLFYFLFFKGNTIDCALNISIDHHTEISTR